MKTSFKYNWKQQKEKNEINFHRDLGDKLQFTNK